MTIGIYWVWASYHSVMHFESRIIYTVGHNMKNIGLHPDKS